MRKKAFILCGFTLIMGIFAALLRWLQNLNAFEPDTNLAIPNAPTSYAVVLFAVLFAILLFLLVRNLKENDFASSFPEVYSSNIPFLGIAAWIIGAIMAIGGLLTINRFLQDSHSMFDLILGCLSFVSAAGTISLITSSAKAGKQSSGSFGAVSSVLFLCFWLIASYKFSASDPVVWHFALRLLAISAALLAYYFMAGFVFNKPRPLSSLYFSLLGAFLGIMVMTDSYPIGEQLISLGFIATMLLLSFAQISSLKPAKQ